MRLPRPGTPPRGEAGVHLAVEFGEKGMRVDGGLEAVVVEEVEDGFHGV